MRRPCTQAQPVFYGFAGLPDGKVILVSVLSVSRCPTVGARPGYSPVRHGGFRPLDAEHAVFDASGSDCTGPRRGGQPAQALVQSEPALGEPVVRTGRRRQAAVGISDGGSRQQRLSDVAVAARPRQPGRRRRGTRPAGGTTPPSPRGGDQGQLREQGQKVLAKRRISPPPANNPLFGVSKVRAAALMKTFGAEMTGNQRTLPRTKLLQQLKKHRQRGAFRGEEERRARLVAELQKARLTGVRFKVPAETMSAQLANLPEGVSVARGRIEVRFDGAEDALARLYALAQALGNDYVRFEALVGRGVGGGEVVTE